MSEPKIVTMIPYALDCNLGREYNEAMDRVGEDEWACILDHDMMFTTAHWYRDLVAAIRTAPEGCFTAVTSRMASPWQVAAEARQSSDRILEHRKIGSERRTTRRTLLDVTDTKGWGGVLMLFPKRAWREAGGFVDGLLCVDHCFHYALRDAGRRIYMIESLYLYHFRGSSGDPAKAAHLPRAKNPKTGGDCACRGIPYGEPKHRIPLCD
jgi:GT2 family glycosyltransferase